MDVFSFTSHELAHHKICFRNTARQETRRVNLEVQTDLAVKDYSDLVEKEHLRPLELLFRKAEDRLKGVSLEMHKSRDREAQLRQTGETVENRIQFFSMVSISVLLLMSAFQVFYLKSFFRSKKLL